MDNTFGRTAASIMASQHHHRNSSMGNSSVKFCRSPVTYQHGQYNVEELMKVAKKEVNFSSHN